MRSCRHFFFLTLNLRITHLDSYDCNQTASQRWLIRKGPTRVQVYGTNYCLDAGSSEHFGSGSIIDTLHILRIGPASGVGLKIWQCFDNLQAQEWYYTDDQRIDLNGTGLNVPPFLSSLHDTSFLRLLGQCVDLPNGVEVNGNQIQTWECSSGNTDQIWTQALFLPIVGVCLFSTRLFFFVIPALIFCSPSTLMHVINQYLRNTAAHQLVLEV